MNLEIDRNLNLEFVNLKVKKKGKVIIQDISGKLRYKSLFFAFILIILVSVANSCGAKPSL